MARMAVLVCHRGVSRRWALHGHLPIHLRNAKRRRTGGRRSKGRHTEPLNRSQITALAASALPGVAALVALLFTWMQVSQNTKEVRISEHGEVTNRFNTAITNLASPSPTVRLGGIFAFNRIMQDSPRDEESAVSVLSAFVRQSTSKIKGGTKKPTTDIESAISVLGARPTSSTTGQFVDLHNADLQRMENVQLLGNEENLNLRDAKLSYINLRDATLWSFDLTNADLASARMPDAVLQYSHLNKVAASEADMSGVQCINSDLTEASLQDAKLTNAQLGTDEPGYAEPACILAKANLSGANMTRADLSHVDLEDAQLIGVNLTDAKLKGAQMRGAALTPIDAESGAAKVSGADFRQADLRNADLRLVDLSHCDLRGADLRGAKLDGARLKGAKLDGAQGVPAKHG